MTAQTPFTLHGLVARGAQISPLAFAVRHGDVRLTYAELEARAERLADLLWAEGVRSGDRVAIFQPKTPEGVTQILAILKCGAAYVPIDPLAPAERARFILEHSGARALFAAGRPLGKLVAAATAEAVPVLLTPDALDASQLASRVVRLNEVLQAPQSNVLPDPSNRSDNRAPPRPHVQVTDGDLAYILYTSGSTGTPKGVAITHRQSLSFVRTATEIFGIVATDVVASHAPLSFDLSVIDLYCAFTAGAEVVLLPEKFLAFPARVATWIQAMGITVWNSVPSALVQLTEKGALEERDLSKLRVVMFAGEPYPLPALHSLRAALPRARLLNVYGQTEANSSTWYEVIEVPEDALPIGRPFPNYDVLLIAADGSLATSPGAEGELYVVGSAVASGYWKEPERSARAFVPHPLHPERRQVVYKTGDRARIDPNGDLVFIGRTDHAVKVRGYRVELGEIESVIRSHADVDQACAVALPDPTAGHVLILYVVAAPGAEVSSSTLGRHLVERLPPYMQPERIEVRTSLPRTSTGKVDRPSLTKEAAALRTTGANGANGAALVPSSETA